MWILRVTASWVKEGDLKNEAIGAFADLFKIALAETTLDFDKRWAILEEIYKNNGPNPVLIEAYKRILKTHSIVGKIRYENEDFKREPFYPTTQIEVSEYQKKSIIKLESIALESDEVYSLLAKEALISQLSDQLFYGEGDLIITALKKIIDKEERRK